MSVGFLNHICEIEDPRIPGMVLYPLDEILLTVLVGLLCRAEDFDEIEDVCSELLDWLQRFLPFEHGIAPAQTVRRTLARLDPRRLEEAFAAWTASLAGRVRGVVAIDGKSVRGSKRDADGKGALHLISAWAHEAGLVLAQRAVAGKSDEITAIPELLDMLALEGAIVTIDAMGTQKDIAAMIVAKKADYVLALKGNQGTLEEDAALFFADPVSRPIVRLMSRPRAATVGSRSGQSAPSRMEGLKHHLRHRTPHRQEDRRDLDRDPALHLLPAARSRSPRRRGAHWSVENNLHWVLDVAFREDECRTRKDNSARNLAMIRRAVLNLLKREPSTLSLKRKRLKAAINPAFRAAGPRPLTIHDFALSAPRPPSSRNAVQSSFRKACAWRRESHSPLEV